MLNYVKVYEKNHTIENPDSFDLDERFKHYISNHNKKFDLYLVKYDFKLVFDNEFYSDVKTALQINLPKFLFLKKLLLLWIEHFHEGEYIFPDIYETNTTTVSNKNTRLMDFIKKTTDAND